MRDSDFANKFVSVPRQNALVRDTFTPTVLTGSDKTNIIPASASAEIDARLLPGENPQTVIANLRKVMADDAIKIDVMLNFPAVSSPRKSELMTALDKLADEEDTIVVPMMIAGFTDSHYFRQKGLDCYGFIPIEASPAEMRGVHGVNERISVKELGVRCAADGRAAEIYRHTANRIEARSIHHDSSGHRLFDRQKSSQRRSGSDRGRTSASGSAHGGLRDRFRQRGLWRLPFR